MNAPPSEGQVWRARWQSQRFVRIIKITNHAPPDIQVITIDPKTRCAKRGTRLTFIAMDDFLKRFVHTEV